MPAFRVLYNINTIIGKMIRDFVGYGYNISAQNDTLEKYVNELKKYKSKDILIFTPEECNGTPFNFLTINKSLYKEIEDVLLNNNINLFFLYGGHNSPIKYQIKNLEFLNWPTYLLHYSHHDMTSKYDKSINELNINVNFNNLFICLNNLAKPHRAMMLDCLCEHNLLDKGMFSWNNLTSSHYQKYEFKHWEEKITIIDDQHGNYINDYGNVYTNDLLNYKSLISLVGETKYVDVDPYFTTEKTYKNLLLGQPFVCYGTRRQNLILRDLGFQLYDEIFDDYSFDELPEIEDRIEGIVKSLKKIVNKDYNLIYQKIKTKVEFNKKMAIEIVNKDPFVPGKVVDLYKKHKEQFLLTDRVPYFFEKMIKNVL